MESLKLQVVAVLMPLEIKCHTIPHLKALTYSIKHTIGKGRGSTFKQRYTVLKSTILLHKRAKWRFHMTVCVYVCRYDLWMKKCIWSRISIPQACYPLK